MQYVPVMAPRTEDTVLIVPPFAEEMNKSRRMLSLQAQRLAALGYTVLLPDLYGTGDSAGDFADARWDIWRDDLVACVAFAQSLDARACSLIAMRLGALLAVECLPQMPLPAPRLVLWQPQMYGSQALTQFLRLRLAADLVGGAKGGQESTANLRRVLEQGQCLEISGYEIAPELAQAIDKSELAKANLLQATRILWIDVIANDGTELTPGSQRVIAALRQRGLIIHEKAIQGDSFWALPEIRTVPALLDETTDFLTRDAHD